jgi:Kef-type K+ transport system membrane component KefB
VLSGQHQLREAVIARMRDFVTSFFLPIFFTYTGLRTDVGLLHTPLQWLMFAAVLFAAIAGKLGGCSLAAWASGFPRREAICIGTMMNARALMELIVINVGLEMGMIGQQVYTMLVLMALASTVITSPALRRWLPRAPTQAEAPSSALGGRG